GYSTHVVVTEDFVLRIPDGLELDVAAPLLCAGITTWSPLRRWHVGEGTKVAVVGLGGLGHMGVQLAVALGAEVTVLSQSLKKQEDGLAFGAVDYRATSDEETFTDLRGKFDLILNTVSAKLPMKKYL
ncbi:zinc-binding dehydrogenase, partial [Raoultella terrigena]|uniref:zinc-binding dehydrogenase n=2 Tax=Bacteria TaxID=2 RepID=UPI0034D3134B